MISTNQSTVSGWIWTNERSPLCLEGLGGSLSDGRLGWGEVTPLWFLSEARGTSGTRKRVLAQDLLILSPPQPRNLQSDISDLLEHCVTVGEEVGEVLDQFEQRVVLVVPGDLSPGHRPSTDLPAFQPPASLLRRLESSERGERGKRGGGESEDDISHCRDDDQQGEESRPV